MSTLHHLAIVRAMAGVGKKLSGNGAPPRLWLMVAIRGRRTRRGLMRLEGICLAAGDVGRGDES
jgi:hypothetical protein